MNSDPPPSDGRGLHLSRMPNGEPEIFASVQGEGVTCGLPSVFVRLAFCNLRCTWCDADYTWDWRRYDSREETMAMSTREVADRVVERAGKAIENAVLTGGEPMLQGEELARLAELLKAEGFRLEAETNGTVRPAPELAALIDQWNVSPKLVSSGNRGDAREVPEALAWFGGAPSAYWKFVVVAPEDLGEVLELIGRYGVPPARVVLMPEGVDPATVSERSRWLVEICQERGFRLGTRLQIYLWGAERGR